VGSKINGPVNQGWKQVTGSRVGDLGRVGSRVSVSDTVLDQIGHVLSNRQGICVPQGPSTGSGRVTAGDRLPGQNFRTGSNFAVNITTCSVVNPLHALRMGG